MLPPYCIVVASPLPLEMDIFFGWIQYFLVNGCSATCNFGVHAGEDELTSFYFTITGEWGDQYATGEEQRNTSRRNEDAEPKQKQYPVLDVSSGKSKVWYYKGQFC